MSGPPSPAVPSPGDTGIAREGTAGSLSPDGWRGPRGNFAPTGASDPFLALPPCTETLFTTTARLINLDTGAPDLQLLKEATRMMGAAAVELVADMDKHSEGGGVAPESAAAHEQAGYNFSLSQPAAKKGPATSCQYGPTMGTLSYRTEVAAFLNRHYGEVSKSTVAVQPENVFQTNGATSGLTAAIATFFPLEVVASGIDDVGTATTEKSAFPASRPQQRRRLAFVEDPTYFLAPKILTEQGFSLVPVPVQEDGLDVDRLEELLQKHFPDAGEHLLIDKADRENTTRTTAEKVPDYSAMLYTVPTYHNPTGCVLSDEKRRKIVALARKYDLLVFCDDVYELLGKQEKDGSTGNEVPPRLLAYDVFSGKPPRRGVHVLSNSTFSKVLGPGVRCGWIEAAAVLLQKLAQGKATCSAGAAAQFVGSLIERNLRAGRQDDFLRRVRVEFTGRRRTVYRVFYKSLAARLRELRDGATRSGSKGKPTERAPRPLGALFAPQQRASESAADAAPPSLSEHALSLFDDNKLSLFDENNDTALPIPAGLAREITTGSLHRELSSALGSPQDDSNHEPEPRDDPFEELHAKWEAVKAEYVGAEIEKTYTAIQSSSDASLAESQNFRLSGGLHGGMCVFFEGPVELDAHALLVRARCLGVSFKPGDLFSITQNNRNCLRIAVAHYPAEELAKAMWLLAQILPQCV
mmetsp:Transcript_10590/g.25820  ORF Transcript_10590/g.25820 Transcript_10590/m.25820 type:complete len:695 (+) Transcript_10590:392-2476(+)|eukprot:CAMPEP_0178988648 /NCGR_PEP_ID=MMETSP0795-20121207/3920_1 /TAXON_ID=88552 /ORGANISM="Amoebophrya sp., Strain Ameob2" /LENGTH=694 /DNA_ID=CAMNT_0020679931 /DNA_START=298 /DNA_END=2382 /DNA_ORIENTATION=+